MKATSAPTELSQLLARLRAAGLYYTLRDTREDAVVSVDVSVPGARWEIDFLSDGTIDVEIFRSDGAIHDECKLEELFQQFTD